MQINIFLFLIMLICAPTTESVFAIDHGLEIIFKANVREMKLKIINFMTRFVTMDLNVKLFSVFLLPI